MNRLLVCIGVTHEMTDWVYTDITPFRLLDHFVIGQDAKAVCSCHVQTQVPTQLLTMIYRSL